ncbi:PTS galactitol transporter subunit IIC [Pectinatus cerevisiiphilus]|uniref:PTS system galactitol-specific EIIC component (Gat family) n=1 Tax=Pectinatus cerevisiiphilus TaxID=86956 RepID=A0A4R3KF96_9FIRM|nr:PTS transporter subunit IIC [Pectinatus cerevisiiphilus]TCS81957.1 PTS system galactitol-specific EIIC component (Gat family) [Pectinatus cerevisiiphilus]
MDFILQIVQYFVNLGPAVMLPIIIFIVSLILGQSFGKSIKSGISIGIGFVGIGLVIGLMLNNLAPAAKAMSQNFGISMSLIDIGWPGSSPMTWASRIALVAIPVAIIVNIIMLALRFTRVVNIDIWNIWHFAFTGAIVDIATGSYTLGIIAVAVHAAFAYKIGDWFAPVVENYFGLEGIAMPHGTTGWFAPISVFVDGIMDRIPVVRDIDINPKHLKNKFGILCDPAVMGGIMGVIIGILAGYDVQQILTLGIQMAAVIVLMPVVVKYIMGGLIPVSEVARTKLQKKFKNSKFYIGLDCALLLGDPVVVTASLLFIPLTILIAAIVPGNQILPFGDLPTIGFFIAMAVGVHKGNLFRTLITGSIVMFMAIWISNQMIGFHTILAANAGQLTNSAARVASLDQGGSPVTYIITQVLDMTNVAGFAAIGLFYLICVICTIVWSKKQYKMLNNK